MATLRIRIYNVFFGDAILVTIPETDEHGNEIEVNVLFDVGNALVGAGGDDSVFKKVLGDIQDVLNGRPIDLYVMTHEHMDHIQGLLYGSKKLGIDFEVKQVWMTASSAEDYYDRFPEARKQKSLSLAVWEGVAAFLKASRAAVPPALTALLEINNPRSSKDCVDHIRKLSANPPLFVYRGADIEGHHPFRRTDVRILAPEEDTSVYYGRLQPRTLGAMFAGAVPTRLAPKAVTPPPGVSAGDFFDLVRFRSSGMAGNLRTIDKAANNSSVALELRWEGWTLLFPGDAEEKSWEIMDRQNLLGPVHFLKVSHHGSRNGSPDLVYEKVLSDGSDDGRERIAVVSTREGSYPGVPDDDTLELLATRATLYDTRTLAPGEWFDVTFDS